MLTARYAHVTLAVVAAQLLHSNASPVTVASRASGTADSPIVDLGYALHQAVPIDQYDTVYSFNNIQYATATRFSKPSYPPPQDRDQILDGSLQSICPQAYPAWQFSAVDALGGADLSNATTAELLDPSLVPQIQYYAEDCLHLDVQVPKPFFDSFSANSTLPLLPIVVWIHGGGFVQGHKSEDGNGTGLIARSIELGSQGILFVAINYRLGMFGWLVSGDANVTANIGLLDQSTALQWVKDYAHLFGGDAHRITILSQSAGAGSVLVQLAASLSDGRSPPFQQAILQSPYTGVPPSNESQIYEQVLRAANANSLDELRQLDSHTLQNISYDIVTSSPYGTFTFGPSSFSSHIQLPTTEKVSIPFMVGTNSREGVLFAAPNVQSECSYLSALQNVVTRSSLDALANLTNDLYPSSQFETQLDRLDSTLADLFIHCNAQQTLAAFKGLSYAYQYSVPSGVHAADLHYTFFDGNVDDLPQKNVTIAKAFQGYIANFVLGSTPASGVPGVLDLPSFTENLGVDLNITGITPKLPTWLNATICNRWVELWTHDDWVRGTRQGQ
ncbi:Alpha/Beta hydrolase protein [Xylaria sp. FL0064]|nr:Alpha/Beta hydrolase protein [Xylaria sp. FL0064]